MSMECFQNHIANNRVVPLPTQHTHRTRGDVGMEKDHDPHKRPTFVKQIGNTTIKVRSILPFLPPEEQTRLWIENESLPEVRMVKRALLEANVRIARAEAARAAQNVSTG